MSETREHYEALVGQSRLNSAVESEEYNLVATLGLVPVRDGNQWCVLWGENLQEGIAGFGPTPWRAVLAFNKEMHKEVEAITAPEARAAYEAAKEGGK